MLLPMFGRNWNGLALLDLVAMTVRAKKLMDELLASVAVSSRSTRALVTMLLSVTACIVPAILALVVAVDVQASEPVYVYTISPALAAERDSLAQTLAEYPSYELSWTAKKHVVLTYTVRQKAEGMLAPDACEGLPIRVRVENGNLKKATYAATGGKCVAGAPAKTKGLYLTPSEFFSRIAQARMSLECYQSGLNHCLPSCMRVTYGPQYAFPVKMEDYSVEVSDYYWSLEVTDIKREP